jgi:hypothetical protein
MALFDLLIISALLFAGAHIVFGILIMAALNRRGIAANMLLSRLLILKYVSQFRTITIRETGKAGLLFYLWIISINVALLLTVTAFLVN